MNEVVHFTKTPEIKHFAEVKSNLYDNVYGVTWAEVVKKYLQTAYSGEDAQAEVEAFGKTYKVLRRTEVTAFYDKEGNTLFDITNERLAAEYEWLSDNPVSEAEEDNGDVVTEDSESFEVETPAEKNGETEKEVEQGESEENGEVHAEVENTQKSSLYIGIVGAVSKLQKELKKAKEKEFAEPIIEYLIERCKESESLVEDICQEHKTWEKCYKYIYENARTKLKGKSGPVRDDIVFEWAEDYFRKDDKVEEEKKAKEAAEKKKKEAEKKKEKAAEAKLKATEKKPVKTEHAKLVEEKAQEAPKPKSHKKNNKGMDGQMDLFSLMGM